MIVEGKNAVKELLKSGKTIDKICAQKGDKVAEALAMQAKSTGAKAVFCTKENLEQISVTHKHQGIIAYTTDFVYSDLDELLTGAEDTRLIIVLDGVEDPHNLGSILRSAECMGAAGVVIGKHRAVQVNETVVKTSLVVHYVLYNPGSRRPANNHEDITFLPDEHLVVPEILEG